MSTHPGPHASDQAQAVASRKFRGAGLATHARDIKMAEAGYRRRRYLRSTWRQSGIRSFMGGGPRGATGATALPELLEVLAQLLASGCPVRLDAVAQLGHVTLDLQLVLLEPRYVQLLAGCAAFQLAVDVLVVVADNSASRQYVHHGANKGVPTL